MTTIGFDGLVVVTGSNHSSLVNIPKNFGSRHLLPFHRVKCTRCRSNPLLLNDRLPGRHPYRRLAQSNSRLRTTCRFTEPLTLELSAFLRRPRFPHQPAAIPCLWRSSPLVVCPPEDSRSGRSQRPPHARLMDDRPVMPLVFAPAIQSPSIH